MKIISWNVNGLRAVAKKGFLSWLKAADPDILCLQEIKCQKETIPDDLLNIPGYQKHFNFAEKKGYSGTAVYTKIDPNNLSLSLGLKQFDSEGRIVQLEFKDFTLLNLYLPHGGRAKEKLEYKLECYNKLLRCLTSLKNKPTIIIGDFNIAHTELDLARPKDNKNNIMFTVGERSQLDKIIKLGFVDSFRKFHKESGHYTWWPWLADCRSRNIGWRIDYAFVSRSLNNNLISADILSSVTGSDHCPIELVLSSKA